MYMRLVPESMIATTAVLAVLLEPGGGVRWRVEAVLEAEKVTAKRVTRREYHA